MRLKKVHVNGIRVIGVVGFAVIFLVFLTVPNIGTTDVFESVDIVPQSAEDIINEVKGINQYSVVETDIKFTESDDSYLQKILDSQNIDSPFSTEKFGIEIQTALFDSDGNKFLNSTSFGIPQLSVVDEQGRLLDLGSIQTSFLGFTKNTEKSANIWGIVKFYLDDNIIPDGTKRFWASSSNQQKTPLFVVNDLSFNDKSVPYPPIFSDRKTNFTFTLSDEGRDWKDGDIHYYRVVLTEIYAMIDSDNDFKVFSWNGENVAYELKVKVDGSKKVVLDDDNKAISVFKSDSKLKICSSSFLYEYLQPRGTYEFTSGTSVAYPIKVTYPDGVLIIDIPPPAPPDLGSWSELINKGIYSKSSCNSFNIIPRGTDIVFHMNGKDYPVKTPLTQQNYFELADKTGITTNFGYPGVQ